MSAFKNLDAAIDQAFAWYDGGDFEKTQETCRSILESDPDHLDALNLLGVLLQNQGAYAESETLLHRAIAIDPDFPDALANLARVELAQGKPASAEEHALKSIRLDAELADAYLIVGRARIELLNYTGALEVLPNVLRLTGSNAETHFLLANAYAGAGRLHEAKSEFETYVAQSRETDARLKAANACRAYSALDLSEAFLKEDIARSGESAEAYACMAFLSYDRRQPEDVVRHCVAALAIDPTRRDVGVLLGANLAFLGRFEEASRAYQDILRYAPDSVQAKKDLLALGAGTREELLSSLRQNLRAEDASLESRIVAGFGLGAALDEAGEFDLAFAAFSTANNLVAANRATLKRPYDAELQQRLTDWQIAHFPRSLFDRFKATGSESEQPVFIVGMPRSGTSLVEQILASHPDVFGAGEQKTIGSLAVSVMGGTELTAPETWSRPAIAAAAAEGLTYYRTLAGRPYRFVTDKLPDNIFSLGLIALLYPRARIILCNRDPRDTCLSAFFQHFDKEMGWCYDLLSCCQQAHDVTRLAEHWKKVLPLRILEVQYETLVGDLEGQAKRLLDFLELPWDEKCLSFHKTERAVMTASVLQVRQPVYKTSVGRWKNYKRHIAPLLVGLEGLTEAPDQSDFENLLANETVALRAAAIHHRAGHLDRAERIYRAVSERYPDNARAPHLLGLAFLNARMVPLAIATLEIALNRKPDDPLVITDLARAHLGIDNLQAAKDYANRSLEIKPEGIDALCQLARAQMGLEELPDALATAEQAVALAPAQRETLTCIAAVLFRMEQYDKAKIYWAKASKLFPTDLDIMMGFAATQIETNEIPSAINSYRQALEMQPLDTGIMYQLGIAFMRDRDVNAAIDVLNEAAALGANTASLWNTLAYAHAMKGNHDDAAALYVKALELDPSYTEAMNGLMRVAKAQISPTTLKALQQVHGDVNTSPQDRGLAGFALAEWHERQRDYDGAFALFEASNRLIRASHAGFTPGEREAEIRLQVDGLIDRFTQGAVRHLAAFGTERNEPVFIVGLPRSGTSLVEQIAASHPAVVGLGERDDFLVALGDEMSQMLLRPFPAWDLVKVQKAAWDYVERLKQRAPDAERIIDKLPHNVVWMGHIASILPNARIILCRRDLRDIGWSCFAQNFFDRGLSWTEDLAECAAYMRQIERLIDHWKVALDGRFLEVFYEDLVADMETEARRLIDYLGLPWDPGCLDFHKTERVVMTASHWQVRQPIYSSSVGKWRLYRKHLDPLLAGLRGLVSEEDLDERPVARHPAFP